jgi:hypothetical protein
MPTKKVFWMPQPKEAVKVCHDAFWSSEKRKKPEKEKKTQAQKRA